jgi:hypothetical protein
MNCILAIGVDKMAYLVFQDEEQAEKASKILSQYDIAWNEIACFNGYMNAIQLSQEKAINHD